MNGLMFWLCVSGIIYTYFGYPVILAAAASLRQRFAPRPGRQLGSRGGSETRPYEPPVTLLIAAYNEEMLIAEKLRNSLELEYPRSKLQILVAADGSADATSSIVLSFAGQGVELCHRAERQGKMAAINRAMSQARGEIVVFSDANNFYEKETLQKLATPFADPEVGATCGTKRIVSGDGALGESEGLYWKYESFIKSQETRLSSCTSASGEILALRRELYAAPPDRVINDDFFLVMQVLRQGKRVVFVPDARSTERISQTAGDERARRARIIAGRYQVLSQAHRVLPWRHPLLTWQVISHKFLRPLVPLAMLGALLTNLLAVLASPRRAQNRLLHLAPPFNVLLLGAQAAFYLLAVIGSKSRSQGMLGKLLYLPAFLVNSNLAAVVGLWRFLRGRQSTAWQRVQRREG